MADSGMTDAVSIVSSLLYRGIRISQEKDENEYKTVVCTRVLHMYYI